jgi:hypothetical protein
MSAAILEYLNSGVEPLPDSTYGVGYRCSAHLRDGTFLPCVTLRQSAPLAELALRRFTEEKSGKGMFHSKPGDAYEKIVKHFVVTGNRVNHYDIARVEASRFAIPLSLRRQIEGETTMSWTGFVLEMTDGKHFAFGTTFLAEFFNLPVNYEFADVARVHNHSYVSAEGLLRPLTQGTSSQPNDYDPSLVLRERPYFVCHYDA